MAWGSTAPAAKAKLVVIVGGRVAALAVPPGGNRPQVRAGAQPGSQGTKEAIVIGDRAGDRPSAEAALDLATSNSDFERFTINCAVMILKARDMVAAEARAFELLGVVGAAVKANPQLGQNLDGTDAVMQAWISSWELDPEPDARGALVVLLFGVTCEAYTTT
jgi:hypothetical protein